MTTDFTKSQLALILSVLDGTPRHPASKTAALASIGKSAAQLGIDLDRVFATTSGLLDGSVPLEAWRVQVLDLQAPPHPPERTGQSKRPATKQATLIALLQRPDGATIDELAGALGWQKHTVRGAIAGALKKKLGLPVESSKVDGRGRIYRLTP